MLILSSLDVGSFVIFGIRFLPTSSENVFSSVILGPSCQEIEIPEPAQGEAKYVNGGGVEVAVLRVSSRLSHSTSLRKFIPDGNQRLAEWPVDKC